MSLYEKVVLTHANLKRPVHIVAQTISGYMVSEKDKCTHVFTIAGVFPATETPEEIDNLLTQLDIKENNYAHAHYRNDENVQSSGPKRQETIPVKNPRRKRS